MSTDPFNAEFETQRALVNRTLEELLEKEAIPNRLKAAMNYSLLGEGKRLRGVLALQAARLCEKITSAAAGRNWEKGKSQRAQDALLIALALECIHAYSLIHDDLPAMDDDALRRGQPTCHLRFDEATAILAGDGLLTFGFELVSRLSSGHAARVSGGLARAAGAAGMVGGQLLDLIATPPAKVTLTALREKHLLKTGRLIQVALTGVVELYYDFKVEYQQLKKALSAYGAQLGLAFQITDDLLDKNGAESSGKDSRSDEKNARQTYLSVLGEAEAKRTAAAVVGAAQKSLLENLWKAQQKDLAFFLDLAASLLIRKK